MNKVNRRRIGYLLTAAIAVLIAWGTLSPPRVSDAVPLVSDKLMHAVAFGLLMLPMAWMDFRHAVRLSPLPFFYGAMIELIQPSVGRSAEWGDLWADGAGILAVLVIFWIFHRRTLVRA